MYCICDVSRCVGMKSVPVNCDITKAALKVLCNVASRDAFQSVMARGSDDTLLFTQH